MSTQKIDMPEKAIKQIVAHINKYVRCYNKGKMDFRFFKSDCGFCVADDIARKVLDQCACFACPLAEGRTGTDCRDISIAYQRVNATPEQIMQHIEYLCAQVEEWTDWEILDVD